VDVSHALTVDYIILTSVPQEGESECIVIQKLPFAR